MKILIYLTCAILLLGAGCSVEAQDDTAFDQSSLKEVYESELPDLPDHFVACLPTTSMFCEDGDCTTYEPTVFVLLSGGSANGRYYRCDISGCDSYDAQSTMSGAYEIVQLDGKPSLLLKRDVTGVDDYSYEESLSIGLGRGINTGYCFETKNF
ncbi:MAG: hypothetical protein HOI47_25195 [Candidatus Scalindua sp.]|nr:hypothetical protein [Candidatus Scalindua sp.]